MSGVSTGDASGALLEHKDVHKSFGHVDVIKGVSLPVRKGEHVVIFGPSGGQNGGWRNTPGDDRVNIDALRGLTDDSGGRTEIVRRLMDLNPATASIADELSKQYYLGYTSTNGEKDGKWHAIRVELKGGPYRVRARRGYVAN